MLVAASRRMGLGHHSATCRKIEPNGRCCVPQIETRSFVLWNGMFHFCLVFFKTSYDCRQIVQRGKILAIRLDPEARRGTDLEEELEILNRNKVVGRSGTMA